MMYHIRVIYSVVSRVNSSYVFIVTHKDDVPGKSYLTMSTHELLILKTTGDITLTWYIMFVGHIPCKNYLPC